MSNAEIDSERARRLIAAMAEPIPPSAIVERGGASVLEVGGTWTVFSMQRRPPRRRARPPRHTRRHGAQAALRSTPRTSSASTRPARSRSCSSPAAALTPRSRPREGARPTCSRWCRPTCVERAPSPACRLARALAGASSAATWSTSAGRSSASAPSSARSSWSSLEACVQPQALPHRRRRAADVRGLDQGADHRRRAVLPDRRGDRLPGRAAAARSSAPRPSPSRRSASACSANWACC